MFAVIVMLALAAPTLAETYVVSPPLTIEAPTRAKAKRLCRRAIREMCRELAPTNLTTVPDPVISTSTTTATAPPSEPTTTTRPTDCTTQATPCGTLTRCTHSRCGGANCADATLTCPAGTDAFSIQWPWAPVPGTVSGDCTGTFPIDGSPATVTCPVCCPTGMTVMP